MTRVEALVAFARIAGDDQDWLHPQDCSRDPRQDQTTNIGGHCGRPRSPSTRSPRWLRARGSAPRSPGTPSSGSGPADRCRRSASGPARDRGRRVIEVFVLRLQEPEVDLVELVRRTPSVPNRIRSWYFSKNLRERAAGGPARRCGPRSRREVGEAVERRADGRDSPRVPHVKEDERRLGWRASTRSRAARSSAFGGKSCPWNDQSGWCPSSS